MLKHSFLFARYSRWFVTVALNCVLLTTFCFAASKDEFPGESAKWRRYQSPNFELFSANRDFESRGLLHDLEQLRALFFETFKVKERQPQPVSVYFFSDARAFKAYCQPQQRQSLAGYYLHRPDRGVIAVSPSWSDESQRHVIFHEYIHHLNRAIGSEPPLWYNEGVAELFSTIEVDGEDVLLGEPLPWHVDSLKRNPLLPLDTLFAVDMASPIYNNGKHAGQFYAQSWALLHFWSYGNTKLDKSKWDAFLVYLLNEPSGTDATVRRAVFNKLLGIDYPEMEKILTRYISSGSFYRRKTDRPQIPNEKTYENRIMPRGEIRDRLAELSLRVNWAANARLALLQAAQESPANARTWEVLGTDAWSQDDLDVAQQRWQRAIDAGSGNPAVFHEVGQIEGRRWFSNFDYYFRLPVERAAQLRTLLKRSIECAPEQFAAYEMLAWVEASVNKPEIANVNLVQARFNLLREKSRTLVALAMVRVRLNDKAGAAKLLDQLEQLRTDYWVQVAAENIRAKLEDRAPRKIERPAETNPTAQRVRMRMPDLPK